jgi:hypothetical protein
VEIPIEESAQRPINGNSEQDVKSFEVKLFPVIHAFNRRCVSFVLTTAERVVVGPANWTAPLSVRAHGLSEPLARLAHPDTEHWSKLYPDCSY